MSQASIVMPTTGPATAATMFGDVNNALLALQSHNSGSSAPANGPATAPVTNQAWMDTTANPVVAKWYDGASWVVFGKLDTSAHTWTPSYHGTDLGTASIATMGTSGHVVPFLDGGNTWSGVQSFNSGDIKLNGSSSGTGTLNAPAAASTFVWTLPAATETLVGRATTDTFTNKSIDASANTLSNLTTSMFALNVIDTDGTFTANSDTRVASQKASKTYMDQIIASADAMVFKGVVDCSASPNYPAADRGWTYKVSVAGKIGGTSGIVVDVGDTLMCLTDGTASGNQATVGSAWNIVQANLVGAVTGPTSSTSGNIATFNGTGGTVIQDGGKVLPAGTIVGTSDAQTLTNKGLTAPAIAGGTADSLTSLGIRSTAAAFDMKFANAETLTANHTVAWTLGNADRSISLGGNLSISGGYTMSGAFSFTGTLTANTALTFPTAGTLATLAGTETLTNKSLTSPAMTGTPTAPTATGGTNTTQLATTAFVAAAVVASTTGVASVDGQTGGFTTGNGIDSSGKVIELTAARRTLPTTQVFLSGSGTYTTPANCLWIEVEMIGAGGGGGGNGSSGGSAGGTGGNTTFGTSLLTANGGAGGGLGSGSSASGSSGGTASGGDINVSGANGSGSVGSGGNGSSPSGAVSTYGGAGASSNVAAAGGAAQANSGSGGAGAGGVAGVANTGGAGAAGGFLKKLIATPSSTYAYAVGAAGSAGTAGASGFAGGAGGAGRILVVEHYGS